MGWQGRAAPTDVPTCRGCKFCVMHTFLLPYPPSFRRQWSSFLLAPALVQKRHRLPFSRLSGREEAVVLTALVFAGGEG
jgi:hypothetical protein